MKNNKNIILNLALVLVYFIPLLLLCYNGAGGDDIFLWILFSALIAVHTTFILLYSYINKQNIKKPIAGVTIGFFIALMIFVIANNLKLRIPTEIIAA